MATFRENLLARRDRIAEELAGTRIGDSNEFVLRRYEELQYLVQILSAIDTLEADAANDAPYEIITIGET